MPKPSVFGKSPIIEKTVMRWNILANLVGFEARENSVENVTFNAPTLSALKKAGITAFFTVYARYSDSECPGTMVEAIGDFQSSEEANAYVAELDSKYGKGSKKKLGNVRVAP